MAATSIY